MKRSSGGQDIPGKEVGGEEAGLLLPHLHQLSHHLPATQQLYSYRRADKYLYPVLWSRSQREPEKRGSYELSSRCSYNQLLCKLGRYVINTFFIIFTGTS